MTLSSFWCAVRVAPRHEAVVGTILSHKGYDQFIPTYRTSRRWSDRTKGLDAPLFPGYVFCKITKDATGPIVTTPGVVRILSFGGVISAIQDDEIESLKKEVGSGKALTPSSWMIGRKVQVKEGPLAGVIGTLQRVANGCRLIISIDMLVKAVSIAIDVAEVAPIVA